MTWLITLSDAALYLCFSMLLGSCLLASLPENKKVPIRFSNRCRVMLALLIPLLAFVPVLDILFQFSANRDISAVLTSVLLHSRTGSTWLVAVIVSIFLVLFFLNMDIQTSRLNAGITLMWVSLLAFIVNWSGHIAALSPIWGYLANTIHFISMAFWTGILFIISWKSTADSNWDVFRKWFTPFAFSCVLLILVTGIILMKYTVPEYWNSWLLPYGEALLLKHLLYSLVLIFAFINGFVQKRQMNIKWLRAESIVIFVVFIVTAFMSQSVPPKNVSESIDNAGTSPMITAITGKEWDSKFSVALTWNPKMMIFIGIAILISVLMLQIYEHKTSPYLFALFGCLLVLSLFFTILFAIEPLI
ncbi:hypothetical protein CVD28_08030 [Bacillus sp. M6-12]|uniref:copper resistance D family protein n=1 Tax=Bacillus sp. M6-12 TaxID=2054166 RepID=UPI000C78FE83|nr:CopD family protein [Bacillus sp. M6-12]PLS18226.1 hypothetical protein CVD28_08030 [Bacillus sp. M6-12]